MLKFIKYIEHRQLGKRKYPFCLYKCICGKEKIINKYSVSKGQTKSCGCLHKKNTPRLPVGEAAFNVIFYSYKINAKNRNIDFNIDKEIFRVLTKQNCYYCGIEPSTTFERKPNKNGNKFNGNYTYNGLDRKDNKKGYFLENVLTCCEFCNYSKLDRTFEEFIDWIKKVEYNLRNKYV